MKFTDMAGMGFANLWRTKMRASLTILGVVIGIGTLTSMVSFGTGLQKNITDAFYRNDLFTSMSVTPKSIDLDELRRGDFSRVGDMLEETPKPLTDSILDAIRSINGVEIAFPDETFPGRLEFEEKETRTNIQPFPVLMGAYNPYNDLLAGSFFNSDSAGSVVISWEVFRDLGIIVEHPGLDYELTGRDSVKHVRIVPADSLIGRSIRIVTAAFNQDIHGNPLNMLIKPDFQPFEEVSMEYTISGILRPENEFSFNRFRGGVYVPLGTARNIPRLSFSSVWDILDSDKKEGTYSSIYVRVEKIEEMGRIRSEIEAMGAGVFSLSDQLKEIRLNFMIMDSLLGAIGTIALIIAALGIINTMLMSILERTREIGIMKAVGGSENGIKLIFFVEASFIGLIGAIFGLLLGWGVTRIANQIMNSRIIPDLNQRVDLFYFPLWLISGAIAFSILVSLAAGLYPAIRAARIDPVRALRHD
jgi:putative ABC transport system permease protein